MYVVPRHHVEIYLDRFDLGDDLFKVGVVGLKDKFQFSVVCYISLRADGGYDPILNKPLLFTIS